MLLTTAVKSAATYDAKPRAVNYFRKGTKSRESISRPRAAEEGTMVVFHSPAIVDRSITLDVDIVFDTFEETIFDTVGNAFKAAAGIPVFMPASTFLLAAGELIRIAGAVGEGVFDRKPVFSASSSVNLDLPGTVPTQPGFMLMTSADVDSLEPVFRRDHHVDPETARLVDRAGSPYVGDICYVVLAVDGTPRDELKDFAPTQASAALLSRFLGIKDGQNEPLSPLLDALKLYNDLTYRRRIDQLDKELASMPDGDDKEARKKDREALLKNILNDVLRPVST